MISRVVIVVIIVGVITAFDLQNILEKRDKPNRVCYQHPLDIVFVLDASSSIWAQNFTKAKAFVNSFLEPYEIGPNKVRVALETYAHEVFVNDVIYFQDFSEKQSLQKHISKIVWHAGHRTETGMGIAFMTDYIMPQARSGLPKICIVITDGNSQEPKKTAKEARRAREAGIDMFAIGVSKDVTREELENIAGSEDRVIIVDTYAELEAVKDKLSGKTCRDIPTEPPTESETQPPTESKTEPPTERPSNTEECGHDLPTDIYYVFDPAYLGVTATSWVTQFIIHTLRYAESFDLHFGVISGSCPLEAGFNLNTYSSFAEARTHLSYYDRSRLSTLVQYLIGAYTTARGGRCGVRKVAVIFVGGKIDAVAVIKAAKRAQRTGIDIFLSGANNAQNGLLEALIEENIGFNLAEFGTGAQLQADIFIQQLCN